MRLTLRIVSAVALALFVAMVGVHVFANLRGRDILIKKLQVFFGDDVLVGSVSTRLPFDLVVKDVAVRDWLLIRKAVARMGMLDMFKDDYVLPELRIKGLRVVLERRKEPASPLLPDELQITAPVSVSEDGSEKQASQSCPAWPGLPCPVVLGKLSLDDSSVSYTDATNPEQPMTVTVENIRAEVSNVRWPLKGPTTTVFVLEGKIPSHAFVDSGTVKLEGWVDFFKRDIQATVAIDGLDAAVMAPHLGDWIDVDKAGIQKARLKFRSTVTGADNDVSMACRAELVQLEFKPRPEGQKESKIERITQTVLGMLGKMDQGAIALDFTYRTKFDSPEFGINVVRDAVMAKLSKAPRQRTTAEKIIRVPAKVVEETVSTAADLTKSVINNTVTIGQELKKSVEASFSRDREEDVEETAEEVSRAGNMTGATNTTNTTQ